MSPENANVFLVEDDDDSRATTTEFLGIRGHKVVETASTLPEALAKIPSLRKKCVQVAVVDGNLTADDGSGCDGERVAREIKSSFPEIVVVGHALENPILSADINSPKIKGGMSLADTVTEA